MNHQDVMDRLADQFVDRGVPEYIRSDAGSEFTAQAVRDYLKAVGVSTALIHRARQPFWENGYVESFNAKLRDQLLNSISLRHVVGGEGVGREMAQGVQPATASQRLGLSISGARRP